MYLLGCVYKACCVISYEFELVLGLRNGVASGDCGCIVNLKCRIKTCKFFEVWQWYLVSLEV